MHSLLSPHMHSRLSRRDLSDIHCLIPLAAVALFSSSALFPWLERRPIRKTDFISMYVWQAIFLGISKCRHRQTGQFSPSCHSMSGPPQTYAPQQQSADHSFYFIPAVAWVAAPLASIFSFMSNLTALCTPKRSLKHLNGYLSSCPRVLSSVSRPKLSQQGISVSYLRDLNSCAGPETLGHSQKPFRKLLQMRMHAPVADP